MKPFVWEFWNKINRFSICNWKNENDGIVQWILELLANILAYQRKICSFVINISKAYNFFFFRVCCQRFSLGNKICVCVARFCFFLLCCAQFNFIKCAYTAHRFIKILFKKILFSALADGWLPWKSQARKQIPKYWIHKQTNDSRQFTWAVNCCAVVFFLLMICFFSVVYGSVMNVMSERKNKIHWIMVIESYLATKNSKP